MKIDVFPHIFPTKYLEALRKKVPSNVYEIYEQVERTPGLVDIERRLRILDKYDDVVQILNIASPPIETMVEPKDAVELCRLANDELAELLIKYPDRFVGAIASIPMNDVEAAVIEADRAIRELGFRGVQIYTDVAGKPLDSPEFKPLFEKMVSFNLPILMHPWRKSSQPDYPGEKRSKYAAYLVFGWPYETTLAMSRLVYGGVMDDLPDLKIVTHHCGGMVPFFEQRIKGNFDYNEVSLRNRYRRVFRKEPIEYFRSFYNDTAVYGSTPALMCGYAFFGADHILFGTDMPYESQFGERFTRDTIRSIENMDISKEDKIKIFEGNAKKLFRLPV